MRYARDIVFKHISEKHPGCPEAVAWLFAEQVASKDWHGAKLGAAVGITLQNFLRHYMTDYDQLLLCGHPRDEARRRVQPRVNAMIAAWKRPKKPSSAKSERHG